MRGALAQTWAKMSAALMRTWARGKSRHPPSSTIWPAPRSTMKSYSIWIALFHSQTPSKMSQRCHQNSTAALTKWQTIWSNLAAAVAALTWMSTCPSSDKNWSWDLKKSGNRPAQMPTMTLMLKRSTYKRTNQKTRAKMTTTSILFLMPRPKRSRKWVCSHQRQWSDFCKSSRELLLSTIQTSTLLLTFRTRKKSHQNSSKMRMMCLPLPKGRENW